MRALTIRKKISKFMDKYVFSTRYLGKGYAFSKSEKLPDNSEIVVYLQNHFWNEKNIFSLYHENKEMLRSIFEKKQIEFDDSMDETDLEEAFNQNADFQMTLRSVFKEKGIVQSNEELSNCLGDDNVAKIQSRFSYYVLNKAPSTNNQVFAVPHIKWVAETEWMRSLCTHFGDGLTSEDTLFLIMHDDDVPDYAHTPFKIFENEEIKVFKLKGINFHLKLIVFQHSTNDVVDLLINPDLNEQDVF